MPLLHDPNGSEESTKGAKTAQESYTNVASESDSATCLSSKRLLELAEAIRKGATDDSSSFVRHPLDLESLEMLEAELSNQGILPQMDNDPDKMSRLVAKRADVEINLWRWKAKRLNIEASQLRFVIDVPKYVIRWGHELEVALYSDEATNSLEEEEKALLYRPGSSQNKESVRVTLSYLEQFAAYLTGAYSDAQNKYARGLNVVLRVLSLSAADGELQPPDSDGRLTICLPIGQEEFLKQLQSLR